ncbi:MAG: pyridoxamine 5'-phosphate oxidase family protein, partial [Hyphomicrobiaceae bacterium]
MTSGDISRNGPSAATQSAATDAATLMTGARRAALATLDRTSGHPYVSLVTIAVDANGSPLMLLSRLAKHTQNLEADPRASLLFEPASATGSDPLASARVTVMGVASPTPSPTARAKFLQHHPDAEMYASFGDFAFYALTLQSAHFIGGFGRIIEIPAP